MAVVEVGALQRSSNLLPSQIHRKGRYIHPLRTGRNYKCLENRVLGPLLKKNSIKLLPHKGSVFPTYTILRGFNPELQHHTGPKGSQTA